MKSGNKVTDEIVWDDAVKLIGTCKQGIWIKRTKTVIRSQTKGAGT